MSKFRQHFFVCINARPPFAKPSCSPRDSNQILMMLKEEIEKHGLLEEVKVTSCGCLGPCEDGPILVVYPEATWYKGVRPEDVAEIVENHVLNNKPIERLRFDWTETP